MSELSSLNKTCKGNIGFCEKLETKLNRSVVHVSPCYKYFREPDIPEISQLKLSGVLQLTASFTHIIRQK